MRAAGVQGLSGCPRYRTSALHTGATGRVYLQFACDDQNQPRVIDIIEHPTRQGKVYCSVVLDVS